MKHAVVILAAVAVAGVTGCDREPAGPPGRIDVQALLGTRCTECHILEEVEEHHFDRTGWEDVIDEMIGKGARLGPAERLAVIDFLAERDADLPKTEHHDEDDDDNDNDNDNDDDDTDGDDEVDDEDE